MFEFHGWARIRLPDDEGEYTPIGRGIQFDAIKRIRAAVNEAHDEFSALNLLQAGNGLVVLSAHGLRNHRHDPVIELYRWVATEFPGSYGLLYVHDDEDFSRGSDFSDDFRVWRLACGRFNEAADPFLSPCSQVVEAPHDSSDPA